MGYKFKLQKILDYKETIEGLKKTEYSIAIQNLNQEEEILSNYFNKKNRLIKEMDSIKEKIKVGELRTYNNYLLELDTNIKKQLEIVNSAKDIVNKKQEELVDSMQERKAFDKLKEKDYDEYLLEEKREEAKLVDQIVTFNTNSQ